MVKRFALITSSGEGQSLAYRAKREGLDVAVGMMQDWTHTYTPEESKQDKAPEEAMEKKRRLKNFSGMVPQTSPEKLLKGLSKLSGTEKEQSFVFIDMNYNFKYSPELLDLNIPGNFPLLEDRILESDREAGKNFVKEHYTELKLTEVHDYNNAQEALDFLEENMAQGDQAKLWVLKGNDAGAETIVPLNNDTAAQAYQTIKTALEKDTQVYEGKGFLLEEFIKDAIEITPQCVFYNGEPIYYSVDIEIKKKGSGLSGRTTGCGANLIFRTKPEDSINKMAFPPIIYQMAKQRKGLFIWDSSILCNPENGEYYFGEFCCNRWGWDCTVTEMEMAGGVTKYLDAVMAGQAPFDYGQFGFGVRIYNELDDKEFVGHSAADVPFSAEQQVADHVWPLYVYADDSGMKSSGYGEDLAVVTAMGDSIEEAAEKCYEYMNKIGFKDYSRLSIDDVLSTRSAGTILNRFKYGNDQGLYNVSNGDKPVDRGDNYTSDVIKISAMPEYKPTGNPLMDMLGQAIASNEQLQKTFETKIKSMEQEYAKQLAEALEKVRTEMAVKSVDVVKSAQQTSEFTNALKIISSGIESLKGSFLSLKQEPMDLTGIQAALSLLPSKNESLQQAQYLIKISDAFVDLRKDNDRILAALTAPKPDNISKAITTGFTNLQKHFSKEFEKFAKTSQQVVVTGGNSGGKGGYLATTLKSSTLNGVPSEVNVGTGSSQLLALNNNRKRFIVQNVGTTKIYLLLGTGTASTSLYSVVLPGGTAANDGTGGSYIDELWQGPVEVVSSGTGGNVALTEII